MTKIVPVLEQLNDLSETQIMLIKEIKDLRERVASLEADATRFQTPSPEPDNNRIADHP